MRKSKTKKLVSLLLAAVMLLTMATFTAVAEDSKPLLDSVNLHEVTEVDVADITVIDVIYETGGVLPRNTNASIVATNSDVSAQSAQDEFPVALGHFNRQATLTNALPHHILTFTAPTAREYVIQFASDNSFMRITLGILHADGSIGLTNVELANGGAIWFGLPAGEWVWVVWNPYNFTLGNYHVMANGFNPAGAISMRSMTPTLNVVYFNYPGGIIGRNGVIWVDPVETALSLIQDFALSLPPTMSITPTWELRVNSGGGSGDTFVLDTALWLTNQSFTGLGGFGTFRFDHVPGYNQPQEIIWLQLRDVPARSPISGHYSWFSQRRSGSLIHSIRLTSQTDPTDGIVVLCRQTGEMIYWRGNGNVFCRTTWGTPVLNLVTQFPFPVI
ncbi:MAG: hypothetical protein FWF76_03445 [Oscillospiraceae bacterium]|nr:hypothetical protein [Oscillospiraceae bacterium]